MTIQLINDKTIEMMKTRLKRDEMAKSLYTSRLALYRANILLEAEQIKISDVRLEMYEHLIALNRLCNKCRCNNINIELEHRKMAEMKLNIVKQMIELGTANINGPFDITRERKMDNLIFDIHCSYPPDWEENRKKYEDLRIQFEFDIKTREDKIDTFVAKTAELLKVCERLLSDKQALEAQVNRQTAELLELNSMIEETPEAQPVLFVNILSGI